MQKYTFTSTELRGYSQMMGLCVHKRNLQFQHMLEIKTMEYSNTCSKSHSYKIPRSNGTQFRQTEGNKFVSSDTELTDRVQEPKIYSVTCKCCHMRCAPCAFLQGPLSAWVHLWSCYHHDPAVHHRHCPMNTHLRPKSMPGNVSHPDVQPT